MEKAQTEALAPTRSIQADRARQPWSPGAALGRAKCSRKVAEALSLSLEVDWVFQHLLAQVLGRSSLAEQG